MHHFSSHDTDLFIPLNVYPTGKQFKCNCGNGGAKVAIVFKRTKTGYLGVVIFHNVMRFFA